jgi:hypothetical protein
MNLFRTRAFREIVVGQHPGQHCAKLARRALFDARWPHNASITPKRLSELLSESATRDRIGANVTCVNDAQA